MGPWLFWHRRDLRLSDNLGLIAAAQASSSAVGSASRATGARDMGEREPSDTVSAERDHNTTRPALGR